LPGERGEAGSGKSGLLLAAREWLLAIDLFWNFSLFEMLLLLRSANIFAVLHHST